ncbi:DUF2958 domain-containing protein [Methylobacterium sp. Leaf93]|uniref:DUF2958 domain-containing protein n=1 Tax=Methylobacterium sp. Leaf93 TaxID=1736249 RepID=UPI0006F20CCF|nr:DUF2958 domain-containing protein [Methylobacterium sp. Leaf93]KQP02578.1 transposase [Methylobacterium sp. Leaf93]
MITDADRSQLLTNGHKSQHDPNFDPPPVIRLFMPDGPGTCLLSELDPTEPDRAFGLCDIGHGCPELGYVLISELHAIRGRLRLPIERDAHFTPDRPLSQYAREARAAGRITT